MIECPSESVFIPIQSGGWVMPPEAKSAMDAAPTSCYDEGSASVFGEQTGSERRLIFAKRVPAEPLHDLRLRPDRQDLAEQRIVWIAAADAVQVGPGYE